MPDHTQGDVVHHDSAYVTRMKIAALLWQPMIVRPRSPCCGWKGPNLKYAAILIIMLAALQGLSALSLIAEASSWMFSSIKTAAIYSNYYCLWIFGPFLLRSGNPFGHSLYFMAFIFGWCSLLFAFAAAYGCIFRKSNFVLALLIWKTFCLLSSCLLYAYVIGFNTMGFGIWINSIICAQLLVIDIWIVFSLSKVWLMVFSWECFQRPVTLAIDSAQQIARDHAHGHCDAIHILAGLVTQPGVSEFLQKGGVDPDTFEKQVFDELADLRGEEREPKQNLAPFTAGAHNALNDALALQDEMEDRRLRTEHLILALWSSVPKQNVCADNKLDKDDCFQELHRRREEEKPPIQPQAPKVLGCLPLEETVFVYVCLEALWCIISIICTLFFGVSAAWLIGLQTTHLMRVVECCLSFVGLILGVWFGLRSIWRHRTARLRLQQASAKHVGNTHAWELDVREAASLLQGEPRTSDWLGMMRVSAARLSVYLIFDTIRMFVAVPLVLMALVVGNVCGSYVHGISNIARGSGFFSNENPIHCAKSDWELLFWLTVWGTLDVYIIWSILALWHEYAFGWTTTNMQNAIYIDPFEVDAYKFVWLAGGVPEDSALLKNHPELAPYPTMGYMRSTTGKDKLRKALKEPPREHLLGAVKQAVLHRPSMHETYEKFRRELRFAL